MRIRPTVQITFGLVVLTSTILLVVDLLFGVFPDPDAQIMDQRKAFAESAATQVALLVERADHQTLALALERMREHDPSIRSLAVRRADRTVLAQAGDHGKAWSNPDAERSTPSELLVALSSGSQRWGSFEIVYSPDQRSALQQALAHPLWITLFGIALLGTLVYWQYIRRALVHLDPKAVIPERVTLAFARPAGQVFLPVPSSKPAGWKTWLGRALGAALLAALGYAAFRACAELAKLSAKDLLEIGRGATITFLRVSAALLLGAAWAVPAGVAIGSSPRLARIAQPLAQIAASVPATALFPVVLLVLIRAGGGMGLAAVALMLLGTQWYILFNVIAGAMAIPSDLKEAAGIFRFGSWDRWRRLILPGIFPYLVTGLLTAAGGAWNASIVAEYFHFKGQIRSTPGLGATISRATDAGQFHVLLAATIVMAAIVVAMNRLVWQRLYRLAETRFKLET